jgi:hypothetical protein
MNADSYFEIGSSHQVCQDYALSGSYKDMHYGIVSDGCSSAEHSEIGAQILCHVARYNLQLYYDLFETFGNMKENKDEQEKTLVSLLGNSILKRADEVRKLYPISYDALQATLLIAVSLNGDTHLFGWGDGYFLIKNLFGLSTIKIDYPDTNAPFYLATNKEAYVNKFGGDRIVKRTEYTFQNSESSLNAPFYDPFYRSLGDAQVTIVTDGLGQYLDQDKKPVDEFILIPQILDYPNLQGSFVKRTMNFLKRDLLKKGWSHSDDIGLATIA